MKNGRIRLALERADLPVYDFHEDFNNINFIINQLDKDKNHSIYDEIVKDLTFDELICTICSLYVVYKRAKYFFDNYEEDSNDLRISKLLFDFIDDEE